MSGTSHADELAGRAADSVRRVVAEAEAKGEQIVREAEAEAKRIRAEAEAEAQERIESARRALDELQGRLGQGQQPAPGRPPAEGVPSHEPPNQSEATAAEPEPSEAPEVSTAPEPEPVAGGAGDGGEAAARLVAMKLAVDGKGREEIAYELDLKFGPVDRSGLLDDVLARAGR